MTSHLHRFASFELDRDGRALRLDGREIPLQPRVFDLLLYLVEHQDRVVSKEELLDALWPGVVVTESSLQRAVSLARAALQQGGLVAASLPEDAPGAEAMDAFMQTVALPRQPRSSLLALYQGWMDGVQALLAAKMTGAFKAADSPKQAAARRHALQECVRLEAEAARLRAQAGKEKQLARQVELNLALKRVLAQLAEAREQL